VAIEAKPSHQKGRGVSSAAGQALWWPPGKIAGRYLAPYFATARPVPLSAEPLYDRVAVPGRPLSYSEFEDALELALLLADCDARWGDYRSALSALEAAQALNGALPPEYETKRRHWRAAERIDPRPDDLETFYAAHRSDGHGRATYQTSMMVSRYDTVSITTTPGPDGTPSATASMESRSANYRVGCVTGSGPPRAEPDRTWRRAARLGSRPHLGARAAVSSCRG
jgi:hypothetical protein